MLSLNERKQMLGQMRVPFDLNATHERTNTRTHIIGGCYCWDIIIFLVDDILFNASSSDFTGDVNCRRFALYFSYVFTAGILLQSSELFRESFVYL